MKQTLRNAPVEAQDYLLQMFNTTTGHEEKRRRASTVQKPDLTFVVNNIIICQPTATAIMTTKGERMLGRRRVVAGYMLKKGDTSKNWTSASIRRRYFVLDGAELSYYRSRPGLPSAGCCLSSVC